MSAFFSNLATALPAALWVGRIVLLAAAAWVLLRCGISLLGNREAPEVWGLRSLSTAARKDLTHWENIVGRMRSADVRVNFPSVSRCHAAICRDDRGQWTVYPVNRSSGVLLNGERTLVAASLKAGDCIAVGGVEMYFFPSTESDVAKVARRRVEEQRHRHTSQAGTLVLVNVCQALLFLQVFLTAQAEDRLPIGVAFGGLALLSWVLYGIYRAAQRSAYELESLVFLLISIGAAVTAAYDPASLYKLLITMVMGMVLFLGQIGGDIGGGLCQLSNLIFWMTLHTPLTVTERYRHSHDVFPDANRTQPFGSGATCAYPHRDLMIRNDTDRPYQLCLRVGETHLEGAWRSTEPPALQFRVIEKDARIDQASWGGYIRHNQLWREVYGLSGALLEEQYLCTNDAIMMYSPLLAAENTND